MSDLSIFFQRIICFSIFPAHNISWGPFHHSERTSANFVIFLSRHCLEFCTRAAIQYSAEQKPLCTISHFPFPPEIRCCCQPYLQIILWLQYLWRWTNLNLNGEEEGIISIEERKITDDVTFPDQATIIKTRMFSSSTKLSQDSGSSRHGIFFGSEQSITIVKVYMCRTLERWNYMKWLLVRRSWRLWRKI